MEQSIFVLSNLENRVCVIAYANPYGGTVRVRGEISKWHSIVDSKTDFMGNAYESMSDGHV
jgi:hypothetical protein